MCRGGGCLGGGGSDSYLKWLLCHILLGLSDSLLRLLGLLLCCLCRQPANIITSCFTTLTLTLTRILHGFEGIVARVLCCCEHNSTYSDTLCGAPNNALSAFGCVVQQHWYHECHQYHCSVTALVTAIVTFITIGIASTGMFVSINVIDGFVTTCNRNLPVWPGIADTPKIAFAFSPNCWYC